MDSDLYYDKVYEIVDKNDDFKWRVLVDDDFTYIDYFKRESGGRYREPEDGHQEIRTDAALLIAKAIIELASKNN